MKDEITLLTRKQVENLDILKKYGIEAEATDFYQMINGGVYDNRMGNYWTRTFNFYDVYDVFYVDFTGKMNFCHTFMTGLGVRPVIDLTKIYENKEELKKVLESNRDIVEYGEYPKTIVDKYLDTKLENLYKKRNLKETKKSYTSMLKEEKEKYQEYIYQNNKYVRMENKLNIYSNRQFSNGKEARYGETHWVKVEPIKWLIDKKENIAIAKNLLTSMPFSYKDNSNYEESDIKIFLEDYFIKEIKSSIDMEKIDNLVDLMFEAYTSKTKVYQKKLK